METTTQIAASVDELRPLIEQRYYRGDTYGSGTPDARFTLRSVQRVCCR